MKFSFFCLAFLTRFATSSCLFTIVVVPYARIGDKKLTDERREKARFVNIRAIMASRSGRLVETVTAVGVLPANSCVGVISAWRLVRSLTFKASERKMQTVRIHGPEINVLASERCTPSFF